MYIQYYSSPTSITQSFDRLIFCVQICTFPTIFWLKLFHDFLVNNWAETACTPLTQAKCNVNVKGKLCAEKQHSLCKTSDYVTRCLRGDRPARCLSHSTSQFQSRGYARSCHISSRSIKRPLSPLRNAATCAVVSDLQVDIHLFRQLGYLGAGIAAGTGSQSVLCDG